jgi:uncharacterized protein YndB with AHSA1/START domain
MAQRTGNNRANALKQELVYGGEQTTSAPAEIVYETLADLRTHAEWGGAGQKKNTRIVSIDAPEGPAQVGTEFSSRGKDPMGDFSDRSVVTEATPPKVFEFVTEAHLDTKKGKSADLTLVHRYELETSNARCRILYTGRTTRISEMFGMLGLFNVPVLRSLGLKASSGVAKRGLANLAKLAEERAGAR